MAKGRILVVDDDDIILELCAHTLSVLPDTETVLEDHSLRARERLATESFDLLITDLRMPEMDGLALCRIARQLDPTLMVLGALVLGHGRANLQEQLIVRIIAHWSLDKLDATAPLGQFIDQEHLMHIVASQAIGRGEHDTFHGRHSDAISEAVETGAFEGGTTIAVIAVDVLVGDMPVGAGRDVGTKTVQLLVNRLMLLLTGC